MSNLPRIIGLTGNISSGKSSVKQILRGWGAAVVDADELAREVVRPGMPALSEIVEQFGSTVLTPQGELDRAQLAKLVFTQPAARARLNAIMHPRIAAAAHQQFAELARQGYGVVFYEAALLVETGAYRTMDGLLVVTIDPTKQLIRLIARDGITQPEAEARIAAQLPQAEKVALATWTVDNSKDLVHLQRELAHLRPVIEATMGSLEASAASARPT